MKEGERSNHELTNKENLKRFEHGWEELSHEELVRNIKDTVAGQRQDWETRHGAGTFDAAMWIGEVFANKSIGEAARNTVRSEKAYRAKHFSRAWDAIAEPYMKSQEYRGIVRSGLEAASRVDGRYVALDPQSVKFLDAATEAIGIPHKRGEATIDILKNFPQWEPKRARRLLRYIAREIGQGIKMEIERYLFPDKNDKRD
jgi:hypothetical protein